MQVNNAFDNYKISIHTVNNKEGAPGYTTYKVIECYRQETLIAYLNFFEEQNGQQNSFGSPNTQAPYNFYFPMNRFDEIYDLIRNNSNPSVTWNYDTGEGTIRSNSHKSVGQ